MDNIQSLFCESYKELLIDNNINIKTMAKVIGVDESLLRRYRTGRNFPSVETVVAICDYFGCSIDYIFQLSNKKDFVKADKFARFDERVDFLLKKSGYSQNYVAKSCAFSESCFNFWRKTKKVPRLDKIYKLADFFLRQYGVFNRAF